MRKIVLFFILSLAVASTSYAQQKYGHCNFGTILSLMPGTKAADAEMEAYQKQLVGKGEDMAKAFQEKVTQYYQDQQSGNHPPKELAEREQTLQKEQQDIQAYEQEVNQKMVEKRDELLEPLVNQVKASIAKVSKANGYVMVFDTSVFNAVLFAEDSVDITDLVKADLGIK